MSGKNQKLIRAELRKNPNGLVVPALCEAIPSMSMRAIEYTLGTMPDVYIDRWTESTTRDAWVAVWVAVIPPDNCPKPDHSPKGKR